MSEHNPSAQDKTYQQNSTANIHTIACLINSQPSQYPHHCLLGNIHNLAKLLTTLAITSQLTILWWWNDKRQNASLRVDYVLPRAPWTILFHPVPIISYQKTIVQMRWVCSSSQPKCHSFSIAPKGKGERSFHVSRRCITYPRTSCFLL